MPPPSRGGLGGRLLAACAVAALAHRTSLPKGLLRPVPRRAPLLLRELVPHVLDLVPLRYQIASCDGEALHATVWGAGGARRQLHGHTARINGVAFFPLGDRVLTWSEDGNAIVWDVATGRTLHTLPHDSPAKRAEVFPGGDRAVVCSGDGACTVWDVDVAGSPALRVLGGRHRDAAVFAAGDRVLTWGRASWAMIWDVDTGGVRCALRAHNFGITAARIFPGDGRVATTSMEDKTTIIWNASSCAVMVMLVHSRWVQDMAVVRGGREVVTIDANGWASVWSAATGERLRVLERPAPSPQQMFVGLRSFPRDDRLAAISVGGVLIWNATTGEVAQRFSTSTFWPQGEALAPGGDLFAICGAGRVTVWDPASGRRVAELEEGPLEAPAEESEPTCSVAIGLGGALDPDGLGRGLLWRDWPVRRAVSSEPLEHSTRM